MQQVNPRTVAASAVAMVTLGVGVVAGVAHQGGTQAPIPAVSVQQPAPRVATTYPPGVLPDAVKTPGATNPAVTPATVATTIAVPRWTATIRPPASYTDRLKLQQLRDGYAVDRDTKASDYEEDHLISLEVGGSPTDPHNLWPSLWHRNVNGYDLGMKTKDRVENAAAAVVKKDPSRLKEMQDGLARDWPGLYQKLVGPFPPYAQ